ncbi:ATP-binding cassette domain-containing protein [Nocardioides sp. MAH-18]|uniref:ATP-binding cassette domain-containing protein n=1 Tax=Nocardioides agri TaxID=2682843 RepID=A0A6L6XY96_9ACTN|nr:MULTISPECIES: ATP-binding cassette domain-containing protein [unclassified Nocardioides]MBA2952465.1 ATP-binding cassette domain-containing protein [Nocardioides sp. CGMCC 1.13656]MVQ51627.1 ATP-binding cassette domain-containing protein [Nocardioides sp. MAH-18]
MSELVARDLKVRYGEHVALDLASLGDLVVRPGQLLAVTGPSGAGKSTLLWALAGALRPTRGEVGLDGTFITAREQAARLDVSIVPQGNGLASSLTATENVLVPLLSAGVEPAEAAARSDQALALVGLEESGNHLIEELSGGQQQRVALARAFAAQARVLLADEPTSDLDAANRERIVTALRAEAWRGAIVVMATHDPQAAEQTDGELHLDEGTGTWTRPLPA